MGQHMPPIFHGGQGFFNSCICTFKAKCLDISFVMITNEIRVKCHNFKILLLAKISIPFAIFERLCTILFFQSFGFLYYDCIHHQDLFKNLRFLVHLMDSFTISW
jgi:hypothetical protein